jgi:L-cysteine desulfidase
MSRLQGVRSIDLIDAPMCGCIMPAMASSGQGSERLNAQLLVDSLKIDRNRFRTLSEI